MGSVSKPAIGSVDRSAPADQRHYKAVRRTVLFSMRLTEDEAQLLASTAMREGRSTGEVVRARVFGLPLPPLRRDAT